LVNLLGTVLEAGAADAVLIPVEAPAGDSFSHVAVRDHDVLERARVLPPVMPGQGAKALASVAQAIEGKTVVAVMRPCEVKAAVELSKLEQLDLSPVTFLSIDCPGAVPLKDYIDDTARAPDWEDGSPVRPVCETCLSFASAGDLHAATLGDGGGDTCVLLPATERGQALLEKLGLDAGDEAAGWEEEVSRRTSQRREAREAANGALAEEVAGVGGIADFFAHCIGCHNCRSVCPICYCKKCYIEGDEWEVPADHYVARAQTGGALRLPPDTVLFHVGRLAHMSLSCVSCGTCQEACPADIRIAQLFSMVGEETRKLFDYEPGSDAAEPVPLATYQEDELAAFES
jgi:formate dehydrogenase subunit beta